eukprot:638167-Prorocentrum_minimum.AAC.2
MRGCTQHPRDPSLALFLARCVFCAERFSIGPSQRVPEGAQVEHHAADIPGDAGCALNTPETLRRHFLGGGSRSPAVEWLYRGLVDNSQLEHLFGIRKASGSRVEFSGGGAA